eukprot:2047873-Rhodomonas_salina.1
MCGCALNSTEEARWADEDGGWLSGGCVRVWGGSRLGRGYIPGRGRLSGGPNQTLFPSPQSGGVGTDVRCVGTRRWGRAGPAGPSPLYSYAFRTCAPTPIAIPLPVPTGRSSRAPPKHECSAVLRIHSVGARCSCRR